MVTAYEISTGKLKKGGFLPEKSENGRLKLSSYPLCWDTEGTFCWTLGGTTCKTLARATAAGYHFTLLPIGSSPDPPKLIFTGAATRHP